MSLSTSRLFNYWPSLLNLLSTNKLPNLCLMFRRCVAHLSYWEEGAAYGFVPRVILMLLNLRLSNSTNGSSWNRILIDARCIYNLGKSGWKWFSEQRSFQSESSYSSSSGVYSKRKENRCCRLTWQWTLGEKNRRQKRSPSSRAKKTSSIFNSPPFLQQWLVLKEQKEKKKKLAGGRI